MSFEITAADLAARMAGLERIGATSAGTNRLAWTAEALELREWFAEQAAGLGRRCEIDPAGNLWAIPRAEGPWWGVGSHLDSVRDGGIYDGPLGVVAGFEVAARARAPIAVVCLADEEGARYNTPTFGSRALVGRLDIAEVLERRDEDGTPLRHAMAAAGVDPDELAAAPEWLSRLRGFLELHIDQTRELAEGDRAAGVVSSLASRMRVEVELSGRADHAGTTRRDERRDAMSAAARLIVDAEALAADTSDFVVTPARLLVEPNALTTVAAHVRLWFDARVPEPARLDRWRAAVESRAEEIEARTGVGIEVRTASRSAGIAFDPAIRAALTAAAGEDAPEIVCFAGHDAGVLAERLPAGMIFVRNASGISHAPEEHVELSDAAVAATVLLQAAETLAG
ncbi:MAG: Zn-dependent hydrolase [Solirubrobacterales bacterium]|nr:Zn-dependent hydrolase [Solirubrobacterales bacterium]